MEVKNEIINNYSYIQNNVDDFKKEITSLL